MSIRMFTGPEVLALAVAIVLVVLRRPLLGLLRRPGSLRAQLQIPPGAHWLWGHEKAAAYDESAGVFYTRWIRAYGPAFGIHGALGFGEILVLADPDALAHIFIRRAYDYVKSPFLHMLVERILGKSLFFVEDADAHGRMRRLISPCFTAHEVKKHGTAIANIAHRFVDKLEKHVAAHESEAGANGVVTVDLQDWMWKVTLDVIGQVGFNHDFGCGDTQDARDIARSWHKQAHLGMSFLGFVAPLAIRAFPWIARLPFKAMQAQGEVKIILKRIGQKLVGRAASKEDRPGARDLLSILAQENAKADSSERETNDQLLDHICTFFVAGHETTAGALNYTLLELARNPAVQDKLRAELLRFDGQPTYDDFQSPRFEYLDAVTKESLRLNGPIPSSERVALKDDVIPLRLPVHDRNGNLVTAIHVKAGQMIYISNTSAQRLESVWEDGEAFRPERWLPPNSLPPDDLLNKGWNKTFAFLEGPRNCIGTRLAVYEYKVILTSLIRKFAFHDTGSDIESFFVGTIQPRVVGRESEGPEMPCGMSRLRHN